MKNNMRGLGVAVVTPFDKKGEVDYPALGRVLDHIVNGGVDYVVALGTTAETPTLSQEEKQGIVSYIKTRIPSGMPLVVGVGGNCTQSVINSVLSADLDGVSAVLSVTPYYNKPSQEGLYQHYKAIAANSPVPVMLYNVPSRTGVNMHADTTLRIAADCPNVIGIKEACGNIPQIAKILKNRHEGFMVLSGDDCLALPLISLGGDGLISVAANALPTEMAEVIHLAVNGDCGSASEHFMRISDLCEAIFDEGNPTGVKALMSVIGLIDDNLRLPLVTASDALRDKLKRLTAR